ncbi:cactin-like [Trifolium medium]|uniref:Cactin-like n=1 Tax=Trifolium medium TaxID=97028 RepID=A0A392MX87_9FABA|nr:cactin-like [Trifolium medium]
MTLLQSRIPTTAGKLVGGHGGIQMIPATKVAKKLKTNTVSGYSNDSNPFGDSNLNEKFVWRKKIERDVTQGASIDSFSVKAEKKRQVERMIEPMTLGAVVNERITLGSRLTLGMTRVREVNGRRTSNLHYPVVVPENVVGVVVLSGILLHNSGGFSVAPNLRA